MSAEVIELQDTLDVSERSSAVATRRPAASVVAGATPTSSTPALAPIDDFPDGGYGWVIVGACSTITFFFVGVTYSWGVIQERLAAENFASTPVLSYVGSMTISFVAIGAMINSKLLRIFGTRNVAVFASVLMGGGQMLSGFAVKSLGGLFVTNGVILGIGCSMCFMACGTLPAQYFKRRRGLANGFVFAGGGLGGFVLSLSINSLLDRVGVAWTFRILGFITLAVTLPASLLLKERTRRPPTSVEWSLFKDPKFLCLFVGSGIAAFPLLVPPFFIPLYAVSIGITPGIASLLLAVFNLSSAIGRIGFGSLCDVIGPITSLLLALIISALSMLAIWPVSSSLAPFAVFIVINGMGNGGFFAVIPSVVGFIYGPTRVPAALAMVVTAWAGGYFMGPPIAGMILERYGGSEVGRAAFRPAMYYAGSLSFGGAGFVYAIRRLTTNKIWTFA